jgi:hypothetical protein
MQNTENTKFCRDVEPQQVSLLLLGMQNGAATLEDSMVVSYRTKYLLTI